MSILVPVLAGIGALCMSNPGRRHRKRRATLRRRNPEGLTWKRVGSRARADGYVAKQGNTSYEIAKYKYGWNLRIKRSGGVVHDENYFTLSVAKGIAENHATRSTNPGKRRKGKRRGKWQSPGSAASRLAWWRWHSNPGGQRDLTVTNHRRGSVDVTIATWRNANATAFIAVSASGPNGVKSWEAKSQGPSAGGYSKPTQAAERVYQKITGEWASWGGEEKEKIADAAAAAFGKTNPRRKSRRKSRR